MTLFLISVTRAETGSVRVLNDWLLPSSHPSRCCRLPACECIKFAHMLCLKISVFGIYFEFFYIYKLRNVIKKILISHFFWKIWCYDTTESASFRATVGLGCPLLAFWEWSLCSPVLPRWCSFYFFQTLNFLFCTGVYPVNNVVVLLDEQRRDSAILIHVSLLSPQSPCPIQVGT